MAYPLESTVEFDFDTGLIAVPAIETVIETGETFLFAGDVTNPTAGELTYTLKNTAGDEVCIQVVPPLTTIPLPFSPLRPCVGLKHVGSAVGLKVQLWGQ